MLKHQSSSVASIAAHGSSRPESPSDLNTHAGILKRVPALF